MGKYFGTDGIRNKADYFLQGEFSYRLGLSIGHVIKPDRVVIGNDTRQSGVEILKELSRGLIDSGVIVNHQQDATTPMIAYYSAYKKVLGIMITASHNPYTDNGIKLFIDGHKSKDQLELMLEDFIDNGQPLIAKEKGSFNQINFVLEAYLNFIDSLDLNISQLRVGFDAANGAAYKVAPLIFNKYLKEVMSYNIEPDGKNINVGCGSTSIEFLQNKVLEDKLDIGFAFDGDADRCLMVNKHGEVIDGDLMMYIYAKYMKKHHLLNHDHVVLTKMSNPGVIKAFEEANINVSLTDVGDKYVFKALEDHNYTLGGEASGHIILRHLFHSGDGLLMALYMLKILSEENINLDHSLSHIKKYPFQMINIKNVDKSVLNHPLIIDEIEKVKVVFKKDYLVLIRPSGTEPLIRVTMSYKDEKILNEQITHIVELIKKEGVIK